MLRRSQRKARRQSRGSRDRRRGRVSQVQAGMLRDYTEETKRIREDRSATWVCHKFGFLIEKALLS